MSVQCAKRVRDGTRADWGGHQCGKPVKAQEVDPYSPSTGLRWWCGIHLPSVVQARADANAAKRKAERDAAKQARIQSRVDDIVAIVTAWSDGSAFAVYEPQIREWAEGYAANESK